jgi:hypothetical protein
MIEAVLSFMLFLIIFMGVIEVLYLVEKFISMVGWT